MLCTLELGDISTTMGSAYWKQIWAIRAVPKMINFVWRAAANSIPTRSRLAEKHIISDAACPVYGTEVETPLHALVECGFAQECWKVAGFNCDVGTVPNFQVPGCRA